jgi:hypothetical protein
MKRLLTILAVFIIAGCESSIQDTETSRPESIYSIAEAPPSREVRIPQTTIREPEGLQTDRRELIQELIGNGIFAKVEMPDTFPRVWVTRSFMMLDPEMREDCAELVYVYYLDGTLMSDTVILKDASVGRYLGFYNAFGGGLRIQ